MQEHGFEIAQAFVEAAKRGDWWVPQALMDRIYGKPEAAVVAPVPPNPATEVLKSMSLDEKLELLGRMRAGELADTASAVPIVEAVPGGM